MPRHVDDLDLDDDVDLALAESALERLDDRAVADEDEPRSPYAGHEGLQVDEGFIVAAEDLALPEDVTAHDFDDAAHVIDALCGVFNARDLDGLLELLTDDGELPGLAGDHDDVAGALDHLWERRPTCLLTRGWYDGASIALLWEVGDDGAWRRVAPVHVTVDEERVAVAEFSEDADTRDAVEASAPEAEHRPGTTWQEWEDGVAAD